MKIKKRRIILSLMVAIFLLAGGYLIMLTQGWVLDIKHLDVVRTGSILLNFNPIDAKVTFREKPIDLSFGFLSNEALVRNLIPGTYEVKIEREGFYAWKETINITSGKVSPKTKIVLWSSEPKKEEVAQKELKSFWLIQDSFVFEKNRLFTEKDETIKGTGVTAANTDSKAIITNDASNNYYLVNTESPTKTSNINQLFNSLKQIHLNLPGTVSIKYISFHPFSSGKLIIATENGVYILDTFKKDIERVIETPGISSFMLGQNDVFVSNASGTIESFQLALRRRNTIPFSVPEISQGTTSKNGRYLALLKPTATSQPGGELFILDREKLSISSLDKNVSNFWFEDGGKRIVFLKNSGELFLYYLEDFEFDSRYEKGTLIKLDEGGDINDFEWMPEFPRYGLVQKGSTLFIRDISIEKSPNIYTIAEDIKKYVLHKKTLYVLENSGDLFKLTLQN